MTKTTTKSSRKAILLSWVIAGAVCGGLVMFLVLFEAPEPQTASQPERGRQYSREREVSRMKEDQANRPLPPDYARQLVSQSEMQVKIELENKLKRFREMSEKMRSRKEALLTQVETRKLPRSAPADANDTSQARNIPQAGNPASGQDYSVDQLYEALREYEAEIQQNYLAVTAARQALSRGQSFPEVYRSMKSPGSSMPDFEALIALQAEGGSWSRTRDSNAGAGLSISSTADLNNYRGLLAQTSRQAGLAGSRLEGLFSVQQGGPEKPGGMQEGPGNGQGDGGMQTNRPNHGKKPPMNVYQGARLDLDLVKAQALPGRRFSKDAERKGWLYINTWYMIGPWDTYGRDDYAIVHPPEISVDFDAVYHDGMRGRGIVETDSHPILVIGDEVELDGTLRWKFMQSESMHNTVPVTTDRSTYYAYTELYFDQAATMTVAIGTDDSGRVWINGNDVWQDRGTSWYNIDEHITTFTFEQGWNKILVRLENNGGSATGFSFLILPEDVPMLR